MTDSMFCTDERGVSTTIAFTLNLVLAAILISGLLFAAGGVVESERQSAIREELDVIGQRLAISMEQANRTAALDTAAGATTTLRVGVAVPSAVAGTTYTVTVNATAQHIRLTTDDPDVTVTVPLTIADHALVDSTVTGGDMVVVLDSGGDLEVRTQ